MCQISDMSSAVAFARAAERLAEDPATAETMARSLLREAPADPRALLVLGSARRRLGDAEGAREVLEPLTRAYPRAVRTLYEYGATLAALERRPEAMASLRRAVALERDHAAAWRLLGELAFLEGDVQTAQAAAAEHARAVVSDPALAPAADALFAGDLALAERLVRARLVARPEDVVTLDMLGDVLMRGSRYAEAELVLARRLELEELDRVRFDYATCLFQQQKAAPAWAQAERLLATVPTDPAYRNLAAACCALIGDFARVEALYEDLLRQFPGQPQIWLNYAQALRTIGRSDEAVGAFRRCMRLAPTLGAAYWGLANLKVASFATEDVAAMRAVLARDDLRTEDRLHLHFALGKAAEDRADAATAFDHFHQGSILRRACTPYDRRETHALVSRIRDVFTAKFFADRRGSGSASDAPIFVIGLPRSGSTLVEQILASHPAVEGTMELPDIGFLARELDRCGGYPETVAELDRLELAALGARYLEATRVHRCAGRLRFVDKMPNNFLHVGLIHSILPHARIVDVRRHPFAAGWAVFKQHFDRGHDFSYDMADIGAYYRDYVELMQHFDAILPGRVQRVIYEDLVDDTEAEVRKLLAYCGLPFDPQCLEFHANPRAVRTVSSEQVRRPIFREGLERWRAFERWMNPLKHALGPTLEEWRGERE